MFKDYKVIGVDPDCTEDEFVKLLQSSPVPVADRQIVYQYAATRRVSTLFILGMFQRESTFGKFGWAVKTQSFGNTRPPSFGVADIGTYNQDTGVFYAPGIMRPGGRYLSAYDSWAHGGMSTIARFVEHAPYAGKTTVREIIPVWAPASDGNTPESYIASVLAFIEAHLTEGFPGIVSNGATIINGVNFDGILKTVLEVTVRGVNPEGTRYERRWRVGGLDSWSFWKGS